MDICPKKYNSFVFVQLEISHYFKLSFTLGRRRDELLSIIQLQIPPFVPRGPLIENKTCFDSKVLM